MADPWDSISVPADGKAAGGAWDAISVPAESVSKTEDVARSLATGLRQGIVSVPGIPGDVESLGRMGIDWAAKKMGYADPELSKGHSPLPTSAALKHTDQFGSDTIKGTGPYYEPQTTGGKYARTVGEFAPNVIMPGGPAQRVALNWLAPAVASEAAGQATEGTGYEGAARVGGALVGGSLPAAAAHAITPLPATAERAAQAAVMAREGVDLTAGQITGRKPLQWFESNIGDTAFAGGQATRIAERQKEQFTSAALRRAGEHNANRATTDVTDGIYRRLGHEFDDLAARNNIDFRTRPGIVARQDLNQALLRIEADYEASVPQAARAPVVAGLIQDIYRAAGTNHITGAQYSAWRSRLERMSTQNRADPQLSHALGGMREALDDAMGAVISHGDREAWRQARREYLNQKTLEPAVTGAGEDSALGLISPAKLRQGAVGQDKTGYARGRGDLSELARAGEATMKPLPNSGTTPRAMAANLTQHGGAIAAGMATGGAVGGPIGAAIGGIAVPALTGAVMMSRPVQGYLGNQMAAPLLRAIGGRGPQSREAQIMSAPENAMSEKPKEGATATNPETGERLTFRKGKWVPLEK